MTARITIGEESEVLVGRGWPRPILPEKEGRQKAAILFQPSVEGVAERVAERLDGVEPLLYQMPDREQAKDIAVVAEVYRWLAERNLGRQDTVIGVGGGAVTDVAGFVAATWLRGVESVLVPTTLLGAVDAAVGGKTGVNVAWQDGARHVKNMVGAFWHPGRVVVDLDVLERLPPPLLVEGTAEVVKAGLIADPAIVAAYERDGIDASLDEVVPAAIRVKAEVVSADFREEGRRAILNFGHTVGHGVEAVTGMPHGHAVAVGMVAESLLSGIRYGFEHTRVADLLFRLGLPVAAAGIPANACRELIGRDKKRTAEGVRVVLLREIGNPQVVVVGDEEIGAALAGIGAE